VEDCLELQSKRILIREFAHSWQAGIDSIQVMELGNFLDQVVELNSANIGHNVSNGPDDWLMSHRLRARNNTSYGFPMKIAQVCGEKVAGGQIECPGNFFSYV